ncbi:MAG: hypothetical protein JWL72_1841 [Ilumatobacteraceae bacterium]|nr:hypothetical protein [Ilumatobacteraceae bacterium]
MPTSISLSPDHYASAMSITLRTLAEIDGSLHASILAFVDGRPVTVLTTDGRIGAQLDGDGPTLAALAGRPSRVPTVQRAEEYPDYVEACQACGVCSVAAMPIKVGRQTIGVVTVTSADHHGFATEDLRAIRRTADQLAPIIGAHCRSHPQVGAAAS